MKLKFYLASFITCFFVLNGFAQKKQNVYFFKNNGRYVTKRDSADFTRVVQEPDSGSVLFNVIEYYPNGNTRFLGKSSAVDPIKLEGQTISFYPNKSRKRLAIYDKGNLIGNIYDYYPNGKLYRTLEYKPNEKGMLGTGASPFITAAETIQTAYDSTGLQTVKEGNGHYQVFDESYQTMLEEGDVKNGKREGNWKGKSSTGKYSFTEEYANGKFIKGVSTNQDGHITNYKIKEALPTFKGGAEGFGSYLSRNIRYPADAKSKNIQGRVILSFVVEQDGKITDIKVLRGLSFDIDAEAVKVLSESPRWNPGLQNGIPVRVAYTMPINFALGR